MNFQISDSTVFGLGQIILGAAIALWAIFKTRKDAAVTQKENMKLQMQQQIRAIVMTSYKDFRHQRELLDAEFGKKFSGVLEISDSLVLTTLYFTRLRNIIYTFLDDFSFLGSSGVVDVCNNIGREVSILNRDYHKMQDDLYNNEQQYKQSRKSGLEWSVMASTELSNKVNELKDVINKYQNQLINALREDMGINI